MVGGDNEKSVITNLWGQIKTAVTAAVMMSG